ncbi:HAD domain-containing protein [Actinoallomurus acanthiterrae]
MDITPAVLVDVDGVLNPSCDCRPPGSVCHPNHVLQDILDFRVLLDPDHGRRLRALIESTGSELVWATMWQEAANEHIGPRIGLPALPVVPIPRPHEGDTPFESMGAWKARHVAEWASDGRPFAWFDDEPDIEEVLAALPGAEKLGPHLIITVDPQTGLTEIDLTKAEQWLRHLRGHGDVS